MGTSGNQEFTRVWLKKSGQPRTFPGGTCTTGRHAIESRGPMAVTVWGADHYASYGYPGGGALRAINPVETIIR